MHPIFLHLTRSVFINYFGQSRLSFNVPSTRQRFAGSVFGGFPLISQIGGKEVCTYVGTRSCIAVSKDEAGMLAVIVI